MYSQSQVDRYLNHIKFEGVRPEDPNLEFLNGLIKHQLATVPFENLYLHYSKRPFLSLDKEDLYQKIVVRGRGGYCMEDNAFFGNILRSLGFNIYNAGGRVSQATVGRSGGFLGFNHMINIVTISNLRYLVDVAFGADGPITALPLVSGHIMQGLGSQSLKLEYKSLSQHSDPNQRVWVYSTRSDSELEWIDGYCFPEIEFFPEDFEVMNLDTMTNPKSFFTHKIMCMRTILNDDGNTAAWLILFENSVKKRVGRLTDDLEQLKTEEQRVMALEKWFGIVLSEDEKKGIIGTTTELR